MRRNRIIAILLCAAMAITVLVGCGESSDPDSFFWDKANTAPPEDPAASEGLEQTNNTTIPEGTIPEGVGNQEPAHGIDFTAALNNFAPDTVMINVGSYKVTWAELFLHMYGYVDYLQQMTEDGTINWTEALNAETTVADAVLNYAVDNAIMFRALEYGANETGIKLSQDDVDMLKGSFDMMLESAGSEEALLETLWQYNGCSSLDLYNYLTNTSMLATVAFNQLYGEGGALLSDEDVSAYTEYDGYLMAKHILRVKTEEGDDTPLKETEEIKRQLDNYSGNDFEAFFDELMNTHSEDSGGLAAFPSGYLFQYGDMVQEFYDACLALEIGQYSEIVETSYGYHILLRLPINYDVTPSYYYNQGEMATLRNIAAMGLFDSTLYGWMESLTPEYTPEYATIDLPSIYTLIEN